MTSGRGWPKVLCRPTEMTASCGAARARNSGVVEVRLPWWPTLSSVSGPSWAAGLLQAHAATIVLFAGSFGVAFEQGGGVAKWLGA